MQNFDLQKKTFLICDKKTMKPYLNTDNEAVIVLPNQKYTCGPREEQKEVSDKTLLDALQTCYSVGADRVSILGSSVTRIQPLKKDIFPPHYYNRRLWMVLTNYLTTRNKAYLSELKKCHFIVGCKINEDDSFRVGYASVHFKGRDDFLFLGFADLDEFEFWEKKVPGWKPLEVDFENFRRIAKHHGYLFHPFGMKLILPWSILSRI